MYSDLNDFLADLDTRKLLSRVSEPVRPRSRNRRRGRSRVQAAGGGPALLFERPTGYDIPVAANTYGSNERMCLALGVKTLERSRERDRRAHDAADARPASWTALKMLPMVGRLRDLMPKTVTDAPCHEIVTTTGTLDALADSEMLARGRWQVHHVSARLHERPETGIRNIGTYRMQVSTAARPVCTGSGTRAAAQHHRVAERPRQAARGRRRAQCRAGAAVLRHGADARGTRRAVARRVPVEAPDRGW